MDVAHSGGVVLNTELLLKVAGIGILVTVAYQILHKSGRDEQAMLVSLAGLIIVLFMLVQEIGGLFESVESIFGLWRFGKFAVLHFWVLPLF